MALATIMVAVKRQGNITLPVAFASGIVAIGVFHDDWSITATRAWKVESETFVELSQQQVGELECFDEHPDWHGYK